MNLKPRLPSLPIYLQICHYLGRLKHPFTRPIQCLSLTVSKFFQLQDRSSPISILLQHSSPQPYSETYHPLVLVRLCIFQYSTSHFLAAAAHQSNSLICPIIPTKGPPSPHGNSQILNPFLFFQSADPLSLISLVS